MKRVIKFLVVMLFFSTLVGCGEKEVDYKEVSKAFTDQGYVMEYEYYNSFSLVNEKKNIRIDTMFKDNKVFRVKYTVKDKQEYVYLTNDKKLDEKTVEDFEKELESVDVGDVDSFVTYANAYYKEAMKETKIDYATIEKAITDTYYIGFYQESRMMLISKDNKLQIDIKFNKDDVAQIAYGTYGEDGKTTYEDYLPILYAELVEEEIDSNAKATFQEYLKSIDIDILQFMKFFKEYHSKNAFPTEEHSYVCKSTISEGNITLGQGFQAYTRGEEIYKVSWTVTFPKAGMTESEFKDSISDTIEQDNDEPGESAIVETTEDGYNLILTMDFDEMVYSTRFERYEYWYLYELINFEELNSGACVLN